MDGQKGSKLEKIGTSTKIVILTLLCFGFVTTFVSGYFLANLKSSEQWPPKPKMSGTPQPTSKAGVQDTTKFLPGKFYFDDTIIAVTKDQPTRAFAISARRVEQDDDHYIQRTGLSYFDGTVWQRVTDTNTNTDSAIYSNDVIRKWNLTIEASRVLKERIVGELNSNTTAIQFSTGTLQNEISIRSLPGYTKFMSTGNGIITIDGNNHDAYILQTKIYSLNANDIQFYDQPLGITTDWLAFWTADGSFYHLDATTVDRPTQIYQSHKIGVFEDIYLSVTKTFDISINRSTEEQPKTYAVNFLAPINKSLTLNRTSLLNKSPNNSYVWFMGTIKGTVQNADGSIIEGIGLVEYIRD